MKRTMKGIGYESTFDTETGLLVRVVDLDRGWVGSPSPETVDIKITDFCVVGCPNCAVPGTMISTSTGPISIEEIKVGQKIVSSDQLGNLRLDEVSQVFEREYEGDIIVIEMEDGSILELTPNHEVLTQRGWVEAGSLLESDSITDGKNM